MATTPSWQPRNVQHSVRRPVCRLRPDPLAQPSAVCARRGRRAAHRDATGHQQPGGPVHRLEWPARSDHRPVDGLRLPHRRRQCGRQRTGQHIAPNLTDRLMGDLWTKSDLLNRFTGATPPPDIAAINSHSITTARCRRSATRRATRATCLPPRTCCRRPPVSPSGSSSRWAATPDSMSPTC